MFPSQMHCYLKFVRIHHFGLRANRNKHLLEKARELLGLRVEIPAKSKKSTRELMLQFTGPR